MSRTYIVEPEARAAEYLRGSIGTTAVTLSDLEELRSRITSEPDLDVVVFGPNMPEGPALRFAELMRVARPTLGVVLVRGRLETTLLTEALRAGVRDVVAERDAPGLVAATQRAAALALALREAVVPIEGSVGAAPRGKLLTVFAAKGGCGKTTISTNLAALLADGGRREVCLVDLDLAFGDVAISLGLYPAHTIADAVPLGAELDATLLRQLLTPHSPGLWALVAPTEPGIADSVPAALIHKILHEMKSMFDYIVVDTPPAFTDHVLAAFDESDVVALLATLDIPALKNLKLTLETLELLNYPRDRWRVVLNRSDSKVGLANEEVEKTLRASIAAQIPSSRAVPAATNRGVPIVLDEPAHPVSQALRDFAQRHLMTTPASGLMPGQPTGPAAYDPAGRPERRGLRRRKARTA